MQSKSMRFSLYWSPGPDSIAQQEARAGAGAGGAIPGIVEAAAGEREASAADAAVEQVARPLEHSDPALECGADAAADGLPIAARRRPALRQRAQHGADLRQRQAELLGDQGKGEPPDVGPRVAPLVAARADRHQETARLVVADRRHRHPGAPGKLANGQQWGGWHDISGKA